MNHTLLVLTENDPYKIIKKPNERNIVFFQFFFRYCFCCVSPLNVDYFLVLIWIEQSGALQTKKKLNKWNIKTIKEWLSFFFSTLKVMCKFN
jgi:hypothetical protein